MKKIHAHPKKHILSFDFSLIKILHTRSLGPMNKFDGFDINNFLFHRNNRF